MYKRLPTRIYGILEDDRARFVLWTVRACARRFTLKILLGRYYFRGRIKEKPRTTFSRSERIIFILRENRIPIVRVRNVYYVRRRRRVRFFRNVSVRGRLCAYQWHFVVFRRREINRHLVNYPLYGTKSIEIHMTSIYTEISLRLENSVLRWQIWFLLVCYGTQY